MSFYEHETPSSDVDQNDAPSLPEMSEYLLAMRHELRAPLNAIIGMSALLLDDDVTPRQSQYVKSVHAAGESLSVILNDVLDLASVAANRLAIEPIPFDLKSMIEETASTLTPKANERGLALRVDWRPELPRYLVGDPGRTRQVIGNLVGYAVNGTTHGEVVIRVTPDGDRSGIPAIRFSVEDTGIGIAPERLARIFDEYVPLDASPYRSFGVTGLGLRLSAELVRLMNGVIHAESEPGRGNRLWFSIPMPTAAQYETGAEAEPVITGGGRALIVEADFSNRSRFAQQFQDAGWRVEFTAEIEQVGTQLRRAIADGDPYRTCIISHYALRPIHMELARDLKADSLLAQVALVMVTAVGSPGDGQKLWNAGFAAYLRKPVPAEEIRESLDALARLGPTGKGNSLITRHSLAEIRNAQSFEVEGIDEMLASLTAPAEPGVELADAIAPSDVSAQLDPNEISAVGETSAATETTELPETAVETQAEATETTTASTEPETATVEPAPLTGSLDALLALPLPGAYDEQASAIEAVEAVEAVEADNVAEVVEAIETVEAVEVIDVIEAVEAVDIVEAVEAITTAPDAIVDAEVAESFEASALAPTTHGQDTQPEPLLLAAPATVSDEASAVPDLIGPALPPTEPAAGALSLFRTEPDVLAPPAIAPTQAAVQLPEVPADPEVDTNQFALEVAPPPAVDSVAATGPSWSEATELPAGELIAASELAETVGTAELAETSATAEAIEATADEPAADDSAIDQPSTQLPASLIDGHQDALWESEPVIPALDGLVTNVEDAIDAPSAVIEAVVLASPSEFVAGPAEPVATESEPLIDPDAAVEPTPTEQLIVESTSLVEPVETIEPASAVSEPETALTIAHGASEAIELEQVAVESPDVSTASADTEDLYGATTAPLEGQGAEPNFAPEPEIDVSAFDVVSPQLLDQLSTGGGFFTQHLVTTFLRAGAEQRERLATADATQAADALARLAHAAEWVGATRLSALVADAATRLEQTGRVGTTARIAAALAEVRTTLDFASPQGLPAELPAIGATFAEQLTPSQEGSGRLLAVTLATSFASEAPVRAAELRDAVAQGNTDGAQRLAQTLKGMCGLIGAEPLAKLAALVEADARLKRLGQAERYLTHIDLELERVRTVLDQARA